MNAPFEFSLWLAALPLLLAGCIFTWLLSLPLRNVALSEPLWSLMLFAAGVVVVRYLLDFVSNHGFAPFAWWRIVIGGMGLGALAVLGV